jgi:deazaflavin-dependent oxidoreductase (nitroreductase family)
METPDTAPSLEQVHEMTADDRRRMTEAFNAAVCAEFRANGGHVGGPYPFSGRPMILLHHRGARTGTTRVAPLGCELEPGGGRLIAATFGGLPQHPAWYHNLVAHPRVDIEVGIGSGGRVGTEIRTVHAHELHGAEREAAWARLCAARPSMREYETLTARVIPVFRLVEVA